VIVATANLKLNVSYWLARRWLIRTINTIRTSQASTVSATGHIQTRRVRQVWFTWVSYAEVYVRYTLLVSMPWLNDFHFVLLDWGDDS